MKQYICVYDFETDGSNPNTCEPIQLASCIIHNITLEIIQDSEFMVHMQPPNLLDNDYYKEHEQTIIWHSNNRNKSPIEIFDEWKTYPDQKTGWNNFVKYLIKYNKDQSKRSKWTAPLRAGANIKNFDNIIANRLAERYGNVDKNGEQNIFWPRDIIDITDISFYWFENLSDPPAYNMNILREFFDIPKQNSHDALKDVRDEAWMIQRFMRLFRKESLKIQFKGAWKQ